MPLKENKDCIGKLRLVPKSREMGRGITISVSNKLALPIGRWQFGLEGRWDGLARLLWSSHIFAALGTAKAKGLSTQFDKK